VSIVDVEARLLQIKPRLTEARAVRTHWLGTSSCGSHGEDNPCYCWHGGCVL